MQPLARTLKTATLTTCFAALLMLGANRSTATVIAYSGDPDASGPPGYAVNAVYAEESSWSSLYSFTDVSVSFSSGNLGPSAYPGTGTAYLTTQIGSGATASTLIASTGFDFLNNTGGSVLLFSGLDLGPGTYYLVLSAPTGFGGGWSVTGGANKETAPGVTLGASTFAYLPGYGPNPPAYAPSLLFGAFQYYPNVFSVNGTLVSSVAPEPSTLGIAGAASFFAFCFYVRRSKRRPAPSN